MDGIFLVVYIVTLGFMLVKDARSIRKKKKHEMIAFYCMHAFSIALYISILFNSKIPMPTELFIHHVDPWIKFVIYSK